MDETPSATGGPPRRPVETRHVPAGGIMVYAQPDSSESPIAELPAGVELTVAGRRGPWVHVASGDGLDGWVGGAELAGIAVGASPGAPPAAVPSAESTSVEPAAVTVVEKEPASVRLGTGPVLGALGGIIAIIGTALPWVQALLPVSAEGNAFSIPARVLAGWDELLQGGFELLGWVILILAGVGAVVSLISGGGIVRRVLGVAIVLICAVYVLQAQDFLNGLDRGIGTGLNVWDIVDYGVVASFAGGLLMVCAPSR